MLPAALAFLLALVQRPGLASSDTKVDLHVDPAGFLGDVASAWSPTGDLGHVQGGQYGGYLFPMGPFFALGRALGLAPWLTQRLWLGLVLALAAWGTVRLMDVLTGRPRGVVHVVAALLVLLNPYVVVFSARTSVTLLGYAALPWLLVCVQRGLRAPRSWWWPAAFALVVAASGGGVNAAVTAWVLLGPLTLAAYERWTGTVGWGALWAFGWRTALAGALACAWWIVPLLVQSRYGVDFLRFTEQPGTIWSTTSMAESVRLMGYWISYLGVGYGGRLRPYFGDGGVLLFATPVVLAGLLVPGLALTGFAWTRGRRYAPFLLALALVGLLAMAVGFPEGTPLRRAANFTYNRLGAAQFLRTTYKAGPLLAVGVAGLGGLVAEALPRRVRAPALLAGAALVAAACWPLVRGRGLDDQLLWTRVPASWRAAADHVDRTDGRAVVLPGQLYAYYDWGGTIDPILPTLAGRPVATRSAVAYADLHATDLLWTVDALVAQRRALPGQLAPLLDLMGARTVIAGADDDRTRSGAAPAAEAADVLDQLGPPSRAWGPVRARPRAAGTLGRPRALPAVRAWDRRAVRPLVRLEDVEPATVVDGSADGLAALAAFGALPREPRYAGDLDADAIRRAREVVVTDSNRRRVLVVSRIAQNNGPTLAADEPPSVDAAVLNPFAARGSDAQTVAVHSGIAAVRAPASPGFPQFPERRPFAALDGDPATHWQADRTLARDRRWLEVTFARPRDVDHVDLLPYDDRRGRVTEADVAGRAVRVHPGWNRVRLDLHGVRSLRVRITEPRRPRRGTAGAGGLRELRIPGVTAHEALRPPVIAEHALAGHDLSRTGLTYLFQRTTGDDPFRRDPWTGSAGAELVRDRADGERGLERIFSPPAARSWTADGWAATAPDAPDPALDRLAGVRGLFASSARFQGNPGFRASSAFDSTPRPWIGSWVSNRRVWIEWTTPRGETVRRLRLVPVAGVRRPTLVRLRWGPGAPRAGGSGEGGAAGATPRTAAAAGLDAASPPLPVGADGTLSLPRAARGRGFRLEILQAAYPPGTPGRVRQRRAVGIAEITGNGIPRVVVPRTGALRGGCGDLAGTLSGRPLALRAAGEIADLDAGRPLRVRGCGPIQLPAGPARLSLPPGTLAPYLLRLRSGPAAAPPPAPGHVLSAGTPSRDGRSKFRLALRRPARLVLAEGYSSGWRARCDGRELGAPEVADGFGMAWRVPASCREASMSFAPDRLVRAGYGVSALAALILAGLLLARRLPREDADRAGREGEAGGGARRAGREDDARPATVREPRVAARRMGAHRAALLAIPAALALGFLFAARAAPLFAIAVFLVLWRGIGARELTLAAGALLLIAVPVLTVAIGVENRGGYNPSYAIDRIAVHWVAVAAVALLIAALARELNTARERPGRARAAPPSAAARPPRAP